MTYGIKRTTQAGTVMIHTPSQGFVSHRFVGIGAYQHSEWKTRKGAERAASRYDDAEVFTITETLNY